jgi:hypothetical protein
MDDIAIVNTADQSLTYHTAKEQIQTKYLLLFGVEPTSVKLPFIIPHFQVQQYDGCTIMLAPDLSQINNTDPESTKLKRNLWNGLKEVFAIK